ncbi:unknown [Haloarcula marismortui ATCC 43049]|uniref:Uncharacterized protein n=2 Tax=Haloarcula marismortui (strain ATCC 43049 / DSM 3752 / JCM 8966 / VKM B-1809) TaxID=272569 RepID=Q5V4E9_HALMA|nr:unknown [Haloarcula marismortui ATCC 43049]
MGHLLHSDSPLMTYIVNPTARSNSLKPRTLFTGQTISSVFKCCKLAILFYSSHLVEYDIQYHAADREWADITTACKLECYENNSTSDRSIMSTTLTFDESAAEFIIESFGKTTDGEGYIVDPQRNERETTPEGNEIHIDDFAGVEKGSQLFLDDDFTTLVEHVKRRRQD